MFIDSCDLQRLQKLDDGALLIGAQGEKRFLCLQRFAKMVDCIP